MRLVDRKPEAPGCMRGSNRSSSKWDQHHLHRIQRVVQAWTTRNPDAATPETATSNGTGMNDDFRLWGSRRWSRTNAPPKKPRWRTWVAPDFNHPNAFLSEGKALAVVVESFPETPHQTRRCRFSRHRGLCHGRGRRERRGVIGRARGELSPVGVRRGRSPSPAPMYYIG